MTSRADDSAKANRQLDGCRLLGAPVDRLTPQGVFSCTQSMKPSSALWSTITSPSDVPNADLLPAPVPAGTRCPNRNPRPTSRRPERRRHCEPAPAAGSLASGHTMTQVHWRSFFLGVRHMAPLLLGAFPFGLVLGVTIAETSIPDWAGFASGPLIFGGSAQLVSITLLSEGAPAMSALAAALVVNARHLMYSAALVPRFRDQPRWFRWFGPYMLIDQVFALCSVRDDEPDRWRSYYLGVGLFALAMWVLAMAAGILLGAVLPEGLRLEFGIPILFIGLMVPSITRRPPAVAALVAVAVTAVFSGVPNRGGILIGGAAGMLAGAWAERR